MESSTRAHLDADTLAAYVDGRLAAAELGQADQHIDTCRSCRAELSALAAIHTQPITPAGEAPEGTLGRYHLLRELGRGSMGIVLRAYDPELARAVAIKLVRNVDAETRELLRREARSLAKLRHPNVVTVYDVIVEADGLYVAMELVDGDTLRGYCKGRATKEILAACVRAGKGLAAAHDAGVIHRDFKPENVLCGDAGEVKVSDFGLARAADEAPDAALAGTPAYMAPEVLRREAATAASDQFSFCLTVWELLTGERPTGGAPPKASVAFTQVPAWVIRILRRGLERDPAARFPSMHALVAALEDDPVARRRRRLILGTGAVAAIAIGALGMQLVPDRPPASCELEASELGDAWTPARVAAVASAITATSDADSGQRVVASLGEHASRWVVARREACVAGRTPGDEAVPRRLACLERARRELGALAAVLATPERALATSALEAVGRLTEPESCETSSELLPVDVAGRVVVEQGRTQLAHASALQYAGKSEEAFVVASNILAQLPPEVAPQLRAEVLYVQARAETDRGHNEQAEQLLFDALHAAERAHDDGMIANLWVDIVASTGAQKHRFDLAQSNARAAEAALARIVPSASLQLRCAYVIGTVLLANGKLEEARARLMTAVGVDPSEPQLQIQLALAELSLCDVLRQQSKLVEAKPRCAAGMKRLESALGPNHIRVGIELSKLGAIAFTEHDLDAAEQIYQRGIHIFEMRGVREHYAYALGLSNLGSVFLARNELPRATELYTRSLAMFDAHHPTHPQRLMPLQGLASIAFRTGDTARAVTYFTQIRDLRAATYAPEHPQVLMAEYNLALAYRTHKQPDADAAIADALATRALTPGKESWTIAGRAIDLQASLAADHQDWKSALALRERAVEVLARSPEPLEIAYAERKLGELRIRTHQPVYAILPLAHALETFETHAADAYERGTTRFQLARAMWMSNRDQHGAIAVMTKAAEELATATSGDGLEAYRGNCARFLAAIIALDKKR